MHDNEIPGRTMGLVNSLWIVVLVITLATVLGSINLEPGFLKTADAEPTTLSTTVALLSQQESFALIAERASPGVVSITAVQRSGESSALSRSSSTYSLEEYLRRLLEGREFDGPMLPPIIEDPSLVTSAGSGAIVRRDGAKFYVLTNYHVVKDAYRVNVRATDAGNLRGTVAGIDPATDLAVVSISSPALSDKNIIPMGDSNAVKVGSWALAVGSPFGFEQSLTVGVVSALHRQLEEEDTLYLDLIQTDASINRGNSGGPLLDINGRIIGINTAIASPTGGSIGLGFAIPVNTAKAILDRLITDGRVIRGWLGVGIQDLTPVLQEYYQAQSGVLVASVNEKGPASTAGILPEDIIVKIGSTAITEVSQLQKITADTPPGSTSPITVVRQGSQRMVQVTIGLSPSTPASRPSPPKDRDDPGIQVRTLTADIARRIGMTGPGVIVMDVAPASAAEEAGLEDGDVVTAFNGRLVSSENEFNTMLRNVRSGGIVVLRVIRRDAPRIIGFRIE